jgi:4-hydroxyphenylpyruvate dioxygenase
MSKVMSNGNGRIKFPINEPAEGKKKSQIEEYIDFYNGAGVQHIAVATNNIIETVTQLKDRGVAFLYVPPSYYDTVMDRVGEIDEDLAVLKQHGVLVDRDDEGYLLQLFTKPVLDRPTMFFEIIQASVFVPHWREAPRASASVIVPVFREGTSRRCSRRSSGSRRTGEHFDHSKVALYI